MTAVTSEEFRDLIGQFTSGMTVVTIVLDNVPYGPTASAPSATLIRAGQRQT
jgi:hypothetical protein